MVKTASTMLPLGTRAPDFELPGADGELYSLDRCMGEKGLMVMFICNHCPFVKHLASALAAFGKDYQARDLGVVAINANDVVHYAEDSPAKMAEEAAKRGYTFPYLFDESQEVAKAYRAACTPDFFLFDGERKLVYRGQFDESRPSNGKAVTGAHLRGAADALLAGEPLKGEQTPSIGCNIKWKQGFEPDYFS